MEQEEFKSFFNMMEAGVNTKDKDYGETWRSVGMDYLTSRIKAKFEEWELTQNPRKLISLANLCMLYYIRYEKEQS